MITADQLKDVMDRADALHHDLNIDQKKVEVEGKLQLIGIKPYSLITVEPFLDTFHLLPLLLRILRVFPKVRSLGAELLLFEFYFLLVYIELVMQSLSLIHIYAGKCIRAWSLRVGLPNGFMPMATHFLIRGCSGSMRDDFRRKLWAFTSRFRCWQINL